MGSILCYNSREGRIITLGTPWAREELDQDLIDAVKSYQKQNLGGQRDLENKGAENGPLGDT